MKLLDKLTELRYEQVDENCWSGKGSDGKSDINICEFEDGAIEVVKLPHEEDIPPIIIRFSRDCEAVLELLNRWSVSDRQATTD